MVEKDVVADKLRYTNEYIADLRDMRGMSKEEYASDVVIQRAVERTFMNLIQSCIDRAQHIRATEDLSPGGTAKREFEALGNGDVISRETRERMEEAA